MNKLNFDCFIKLLDGKDQVDGEVYKLVANQLALAQSGDAVKLYDLATRIYKEKVIEVDDSDKKLIIDTINGSKNLTVLGKGQILKIIENAKK